MLLAMRFGTVLQKWLSAGGAMQLVTMSGSALPGRETSGGHREEAAYDPAQASQQKHQQL